MRIWNTIVNIALIEIHFCFNLRPKEWEWEVGHIYYDGDHYYAFCGPISVEIIP